jgi:aminomethyltransferase
MPKDSQGETRENQQIAEAPKASAAAAAAAAAAPAVPVWPHPQPLLEEHQLLGAEFTTNQRGQQVPQAYPSTAEDAFTQGCALCDASSLGGVRIAGEAAPAFASLVFTCDELAPGEIAPALCLFGTSLVVAPVLVARTAASEFMAWTAAECFEGLMAWFEALAGAQGQDGPLFEDLTIEPASPNLACLMLAGPLAPQILSDYTSELPAAGTLRDVHLDQISCVVAHLAIAPLTPPAAPPADKNPEAGEAAAPAATAAAAAPAAPQEPQSIYLVLVSAGYARTLWRSFLSFPTVSPVGASRAWGYIASLLPGVVTFLENPTNPANPKTLHLMSLVRSNPSFIGARALEWE